jgi:hypothetical protein
MSSYNRVTRSATRQASSSYSASVLPAAGNLPSSSTSTGPDSNSTPLNPDSATPPSRNLRKRKDAPASPAVELQQASQRPAKKRAKSSSQKQPATSETLPPGRQKTKGKRTPAEMSEQGPGEPSLSSQSPNSSSKRRSSRAKKTSTGESPRELLKNMY